MRATIQDRLSRNADQSVLGREAELGILRRAFAEGAPVVVHLHGLSGVGKSALLTAFGREAASGGATVLTVDCGAIEPTERGFIGELGVMLDCAATLETISAALAALPSPLLLILDSYEVFGLLDAWLRRRCIPALPDRSLVVLGSRLPPVSAWTEAPEWSGLFQPLPLGSLSDAAAAAVLANFDITGAVAARIQSFARGHPLALTLAAQAARSAEEGIAGLEPVDAAIPSLARRFLGEIPDPATRDALRGACVARRISRGLLRALQPNADAALVYDRLAALPFATLARDGIAVHEAVREALSADLQAADSEFYRRCRQAAWHYLSREAQEAPLTELWRCTADLIYLIQNPAVREAFFPRDAAGLALEPARPADAAEILSIAEAHDSRGGIDLTRLWLEAAPQALHVAVGPGREVRGFYCLLDAAETPAVLRHHDPAVARFCHDLDERPLSGRESALFLRRWLGREAGELPSPVQAACWLDIKRHYMERRPRLRRVYMALADPKPYWSAARSLGIVALPDPIAIGNALQVALLLDMGSGSVDGWLLRLAADELGIVPRHTVLDRIKRALNVDGRPVPLTRREFAVIDYLAARRGELVSRDNLIKDVWGLRFAPGSNVVDAVVASLRRKLGGHAGLIETVRGFGYCCRLDEESASQPER